MEKLRKHFVASAGLVHAAVSEDELAVCESALSYALESLGNAEIESRLGATRDEVEGIRDDLRRILGSEREPEPTMEFAEKS